MSILWLQPAAWWGLAALAIPIVIHLLVRQQSRRVPFPSLKFLRATRLAAFRRRRISNWALLVVRLLVIATAVAAAAAPAFVSADRQRSWSMRVARAVVLAPADPARAQIDQETERLATQELGAAFVARKFPSPDEPPSTGVEWRLADSIRDAVVWLEQQPPASREIVIAGHLPADSLVRGDLNVVPRYVGLRILPVVPAEPKRDFHVRAVAASLARGVRLHDLRLTLEDYDTTVEYRAAGPVSMPPIEVRATPTDQPMAEAALRAVLTDGLLLPRGNEHQVVIEFDGATSTQRALVQPAQAPWMRRVLELLPELRGGEADGRLIVRTAVRGNNSRALDVIRSVSRAAFADDLRDLEPREISAVTVATLSRAPEPLLAGSLEPADEGDRRYFWIGALMLLAAEQWIRRSRTGDTGRKETSASDAAEARVA